MILGTITFSSVIIKLVTITAANSGVLPFIKYPSMLALVKRGFTPD